jgi:hypothetical protein
MDQEGGRVDALSMDKTLRRGGDEGSITSPALSFVHAGGPIVAIGSRLAPADLCGVGRGAALEIGLSVPKDDEGHGGLVVRCRPRELRFPLSFATLLSPVRTRRAIVYRDVIATVHLLVSS